MVQDKVQDNVCPAQGWSFLTRREGDVEAAAHLCAALGRLVALIASLVLQGYSVTASIPERKIDVRVDASWCMGWAALRQPTQGRRPLANQMRCRQPERILGKPLMRWDPPIASPLCDARLLV